MWQNLKPVNVKTVIQDIQASIGEFSDLVVSNSLTVNGISSIANLSIDNIICNNLTSSTNLNAGNNLYVTNAINGGSLQISESGSIGNDLTVSNNLIVNGNNSVINGTLTANNFSTSGNISGNSLDIVNNATINGALNVSGATTSSSFVTTGNTNTVNLNVSGNSNLNNLSVSGNSNLNNLSVSNIETENIRINGTLDVDNMNIINITMEDINTEHIIVDELRANNNIYTSNLSVDYLIIGKIQESEEADHALESDIATVAEKVTNKLYFEDYILATKTINNIDSSTTEYNGSELTKIKVKASYNVENDTLVSRNEHGDIKVNQLEASLIFEDGKSIVTINDIGTIADSIIPQRSKIFYDSGILNLPDNVDIISIFLVGAGAGGGAGTSISGGGGGGAGGILNTKIAINRNITDKIAIQIGSAGIGGYNGDSGYDGGDTVITNINTFIKPLENIINVNELPIIGIDTNSIYAKKLENNDITYWKYISNVWVEYFLSKVENSNNLHGYVNAYLSGEYGDIKSYGDLINPEVNTYYLDTFLNDNNVKEKYFYKCILQWLIYIPRSIITVENLPNRVDVGQENYIFRVSSANNTEWIFNNYDENNMAKYIPYIPPTIISSSTIPNNPNFGDIITLTASAGGFSSGETIIYSIFFQDYTDDLDTIEFIYTSDNNDIKAIAFGGKGGISGDSGGIGGKSGLSKTSGSGGNGKTGSDGEDGGTSLIVENNKGGKSHLSFTQELVSSLPDIKNSDLTKYYELTAPDGNKPVNSKWIVINDFYQRYITNVIDINAYYNITNDPDKIMTTEDIPFDWNTFDFYSYYLLGNGTIWVFKKSFIEIGEKIDNPSVSESDIIYLSSFDGYIDDLDHNKYYIFVSKNINHPIYGHFNNNSLYEINFLTYQVIPEINYSGGGGAGGSCLIIGGKGGIGGVLYSTNGESAGNMIGNFGAGGGGGGRNEVGTFGGDGSKGLAIITW
jgi:hypothetical protein